LRVCPSVRPFVSTPSKTWTDGRTDISSVRPSLRWSLTLKVWSERPTQLKCMFWKCSEFLNWTHLFEVRRFQFSWVGRYDHCFTCIFCILLHSFSSVVATCTYSFQFCLSYNNI